MFWYPIHCFANLAALETPKFHMRTMVDLVCEHGQLSTSSFSFPVATCLCECGHMCAMVLVWKSEAFHCVSDCLFLLFTTVYAGLAGLAGPQSSGESSVSLPLIEMRESCYSIRLYIGFWSLDQKQFPRPFHEC